MKSKATQTCHIRDILAGQRKAVRVAWELAGVLTLAGFAMAAAISPSPKASQPREERVSASASRQQIEADWLKALAQPLTTQGDAAGADARIAEIPWAEAPGREPMPARMVMPYP